MNANKLIAIPYRPRLHLAGGSGSPLIRFRHTHPIDNMYVLSKASNVSEMMMLNAVVLPILITQRTADQKAVAYTELNGMFRFLSILLSHFENGNPRSREKAKTSRGWWSPGR